MIKLVAEARALCIMSSDRFMDQSKAVKKITKYWLEKAIAMVDSESKNTLDSNSIKMNIINGNNSNNNIGGSNSQPTTNHIHARGQSRRNE